MAGDCAEWNKSSRQVRRPVLCFSSEEASDSVREEVVMAYIIAEPCIGTKDASCVAVCPVDCIYEGEDQYYINPDECIDCGACEPECPVEAIFADDSVPEQWASYTAKNKDFFGA